MRARRGLLCRCPPVRESVSGAWGLTRSASVRLVRDDMVRPNGTALKIRVATAGHATGVNEKNSTEITLTEFPDVGATATYFRVSDLSQAEEDGLFK